MGELAAVTLPATPASARRARHFLAETLERWCVGTGVVDKATLLTSELVTNAVRHGRGLVRLTVRRRAPSVRVEVHDDGPALPALSEVDEVDEAAESGRGLRLVDTLATRWGTERVPHDGKDVWFELDL